MKKLRSLFMCSISILLISMLGCGSSKREVYQISPISDFVTALYDYDIEKIDTLLNDDTIFDYNDEVQIYSDIRSEILALFDESKMTFSKYDFYGDYFGEKDRFTKQASIILPVNVDKEDYTIEAVFDVDITGRISKIKSNSMAFKYIISPAKDREDIQKAMEEAKHTN